MGDSLTAGMGGRVSPVAETFVVGSSTGVLVPEEEGGVMGLPMRLPLARWTWPVSSESMALWVCSSRTLGGGTGSADEDSFDWGPDNEGGDLGSAWPEPSRTSSSPIESTAMEVFALCWAACAVGTSSLIFLELVPVAGTVSAFPSMLVAPLSGFLASSASVMPLGGGIPVGPD